MMWMTLDHWIQITKSSLNQLVAFTSTVFSVLSSIFFLYIIIESSLVVRD